MSDMRPKKTILQLGDKQYSMLFTIRAIDEIQDEFNVPVVNFSDLIRNEDTSIYATAFIASTLINDSAISAEEMMTEITEETVIPIIQAINSTAIECWPKHDEEDTPVDTSEDEDAEADFFPVSRCIYIGKMLLGYSENEVWEMTPGKLFALYDEYKKENGQKQQTELSIDDMIPD